LITVSGLSTASPVAVIGGTGRLGRLAVQPLLDRQIPCHFLVRRFPQCDSPASLEDCTTSEQVAAFFQQHPNITLYEGDVTNRAALQALVQDCQACLALWGSTRRSKVSDIWNPNIADTDSTHAKQVNYQGVVNLIEACQLGQCPRIIRITGKGEDPTGIFTILINLFGSMAKAWNYQGEQALRASPVDYTIIRPGVMSEQGPAAKGTTKTVSLKLADNGGDLPVARIRYADIATLCLDCLEYPNTARCTLTAMTGENDGDAEVATSWKPMLAQVQADRRQFPSDMLDQHYAAVKKVLYTLGGILAIAIFGVFKTISSWLL
jgi:uncharacterized protein YbjT (DUF2867 family)